MNKKKKSQLRMNTTANALFTAIYRKPKYGVSHWSIYNQDGLKLGTDMDHDENADPKNVIRAFSMITNNK